MTGPAPEWAAQLRGLADAAAGLLGGLAAAVPAPGAEAPDGSAGDHSAECRTCPVCTALAVLRGRRPDLSEALADVLATAATALRAHARPAADADHPDADHPDADHPDADHPEAEPPEETVSPTPPPAPVQHIEVA